jgi:lipopolysaccharide/colanic/teichoic acid biosynthesis glycosyltransferase
VLNREQKRADRSNLSLFLVLVEMLEHSGSTPSSSSQTAIEALAASTRQTDLLGWFERDAVIGVILPDISVTTSELAPRLLGRIRRELVRRSGADMARRFAIRLHVHPGSRAGTEERELPGVEPLPPRSRSHEARSAANAAAKRALDIAGGLGLLALLAPLMLLVAVLVKLTSKGPVFYRQVRVGLGMQPFTMLKFRSMHVNANHIIHQEFVTAFINQPAKTDRTAQNGLFKIVADPRVTRLGQLLRKTSIDELPQLWNVVLGNMSLVGPRPPLPYEVEQYQRWHCRRVLEAKPGVTGLWQVEGRSRTTFDEMVRLDLRYARTSSLWTDIKILLATPKAVIAGKGAC